ncbi:hypothetical protein Dimus_018122, partial [Dionaea muscipula]
WNAPENVGSWAGTADSMSELDFALLSPQYLTVRATYKIFHGTSQIDDWWRIVWAAGLHP